MKLWRSERGLIIAIVVVGATIAVTLSKLGAAEYVAILTMCIQALLTYKAMPTQATTT